MLFAVADPSFLRRVIYRVCQLASRDSASSQASATMLHTSINIAAMASMRDRVFEQHMCYTSTGPARWRLRSHGRFSVRRTNLALWAPTDPRKQAREGVGK